MALKKFLIIDKSLRLAKILNEYRICKWCMKKQAFAIPLLENWILIVFVSDTLVGYECGGTHCMHSYSKFLLRF